MSRDAPLIPDNDLAPRRRAPTVLVVDDSRTALTMIGRGLSRLGYSTLLAETGVEAIDLIAARGIDLVLLDLTMGGRGGVHTLREIRGMRETLDLPVIMMSGRTDPGAAVEALAAGADDHLLKPFAFEVLAARIERTLARARRLQDLTRTNLALDARIAARAMELGEARAELAETRADRARLIHSIKTLNDRLEARA